MRYKENKTSTETRKEGGISKLNLCQVPSNPNLGMIIGPGGMNLWLCGDGRVGYKVG